ncbi:hypothetical protein SAMN05216232_2256 [Virgibacillus subterraneus]|uniref:Lipoprotein n=1 Tax=Virgibacillus subterraneus TaxID=621109 RepID=A0A1H9FMB7_9BACI|nr:hypothetical protein [Virgibacillus subterraneus]SEQ38969.1 hypothetical protein SAMN05216232_2256 [Virgibacillus subterraneus]
MKKIFYLSLVLLMIMLMSCGNPEPKISQDSAESIVIEKHSGETGKVIIKSINHKNGKYIIEWENEENCESGVDHVDDQNGEILKGEVTMC